MHPVFGLAEVAFDSAFDSALGSALYFAYGFASRLAYGLASGQESGLASSVAAAYQGGEHSDSLFQTDVFAELPCCLRTDCPVVALVGASRTAFALLVVDFGDSATTVRIGQGTGRWRWDRNLATLGMAVQIPWATSAAREDFAQAMRFAFSAGAFHQAGNVGSAL